MKTTDWKIFVVDDDAFNLQLTRHHLESHGYTDIQTLVSGTDCLAHLTDQPRVIFLDHRMDDLNGFEVLKKIKRYDPNIYVVMVSAQDSIETAIASMRHGAFDYIEKNGHTLDQVIRALHRIQRVHEALNRKQPSFWRRIASFL